MSDSACGRVQVSPLVKGVFLDGQQTRYPHYIIDQRTLLGSYDWVLVAVWVPRITCFLNRCPSLVSPFWRRIRMFHGTTANQSRKLVPRVSSSPPRQREKEMRDPENEFANRALIALKSLLVCTYCNFHCEVEGENSWIKGFDKNRIKITCYSVTSLTVATQQTFFYKLAIKYKMTSLQ